LDPKEAKNWAKVYPRVSYPIKSVGKNWKTLDTALLAFKTPISGKWDQIIEEKDRFHVKDLLQEVDEMGCKLKHVIDLTENNVYYTSAQMKQAKVKYHSLPLSGKKPPSKQICEQFCEIVETQAPLLEGNEYIGVHCTGGRNRTGFLVCYYILWKFSHLQVRHALADFEEARGFGIDKIDWIDKLHEYFVPAAAGKKGGNSKKQQN